MPLSIQHKKIKCNHPGCGKFIFAKDKTLHLRNKHSTVLKKGGSIIAVKADSSSPNFVCVLCLEHQIIWPINTYQNMLCHHSTKHPGEVTPKTESQLRGVLGALTGTCTVVTNTSVEASSDHSLSWQAPPPDPEQNSTSSPFAFCTIKNFFVQSAKTMGYFTDEVKPSPISVSSADEAQPSPTLPPVVDSLEAATVLTCVSKRTTFDLPFDFVETSTNASIVSSIGDYSVTFEDYVHNENIDIYEVVAARETILKQMKRLPPKKRQHCDDHAALPTSSVGCLTTALSWINALLPWTKHTPFNVLDVGSGGGKSAYGLAILSGGLAKVVGFEVLQVDCFLSMRDSHIYNHYLPDGKKMQTQFIAFNESILNVTSADGFNIIYAQVRAIPDKAYQNVARIYNNSNVEVLIVSCSVSWKNFLKGVKDDGGIKGELMGEFKTNCTGGKTSTSFRVYSKPGGFQKKWETDAVMQKCVDSLDNLTEDSFKKHVEALGNKVNLSYNGVVKKRMRKKPKVIYDPSKYW